MNATNFLFLANSHLKLWTSLILRAKLVVMRYIDFVAIAFYVGIEFSTKKHTHILTY